MQATSFPGPAPGRVVALKPAPPPDGSTSLRGNCAICRIRHGCIATGVDDGARQGALLMIGRRRLRKGEALFREGQPFSFLYAVRYGTLKSGFTLDDGHEQVTTFSFAGDIVGFEGIPRARHSTHAGALEDSEVCAIPYQELIALSADGSGVTPASRVIQAVAAELVKDQSSKALSSLRQADPRVAAFLLMLSRRMRQAGLSGTELELRMSRAEIGSYLGLTLESVSRAFSGFATGGWIDVHKRSVRLLSLQALENLSQPGMAAKERQGDRRHPCELQAT